MKAKLFVLLMLATFSLNAQQMFYYYHGEKINLTVDKSRVNIIADNGFQKSLDSNFISQYFVFQRNENEASQKIVQLQFKTTPTSSEYATILDTLKQNLQVKYVFPFFERGDAEPIGTSDIFYVRLKEIKDTVLLKEIAKQQNVEILRQVAYMPLWYALSVQNSVFASAIDASNYFYETGYFESIDPAFIFNFKTNCTNDYGFKWLWGLKNNDYPGIDIRACEAWTVTRGAGVKVAVIDDGIDMTHRDLDTNMHSLSFDAEKGYPPTPSVFKGYDHGTHVAGIIAAIKDNDFDVVGVAPECKIIGVSTDGIICVATAEQFAVGITWAWQNGADIINNSWGDYNTGLMYSEVLQEAIVDAMTLGRNGLGCVVVFAAGNTGEKGINTINYPADFHPDILTVGAINVVGARASFSSYGEKLDVVAPGTGILSTLPYNDMNKKKGTSMAAPHVSGIAALILSVNPNLKRKEVCDIIERTTKKIYTATNAGGYTTTYNYSTVTGRPNGTFCDSMGYGLVDAYAAVLEADCYTGLTKFQGTIANNNPWNSPIHAVGDIIIPSGKTLTIRNVVKCNRNVSIIVEPGGKLIIDGGTLTSGCDGELWQGIRILGDAGDKQQYPQYQGMVEMKNGATIENAECAIRVGGEPAVGLIYNLATGTTSPVDLTTLHDNQGGGIVIATGAKFINNKQAIRINPYRRMLSGSLEARNASSFTRCDFIVNDNAYFRVDSNNKQAALYGVKDIPFYGCNFWDEQTKSRSADFGTGIYAGNNANVIVGKTTTAIPCRFQNYKTAIAVYGTGVHQVVVSHTNFQDNGRSISLYNSFNPYIASCHFQSIGWQSDHCGIRLKHCNQYTVANNQFNGNVGIGVHIIGNTEDNNKVKNNTFQHLCIGCYVDNLNGQTSANLRLLPYNTGLQFLCNDYIGNAEDIRLSNSANMRCHQGNANNAAGNCFSGDVHVHNLSIRNLPYYYHYFLTPPCQNPTGTREPTIILTDQNNPFTTQSEAADGCGGHYGYIGAAYEDMVEQHEMSYYEERYSALSAAFAELMATRGNGSSGGGKNQLPDSSIYYKLTDLKEQLTDCCSDAISLLSRDTNGLDSDQYRIWLARMESIYCDYLIAESYAQDGNWAMMSAVLTNITNKYGVPPLHSVIFAACMQIKARWENFDTTQLQADVDYLANVAAGDWGYIADWAASILKSSLEGYKIDEPAIPGWESDARCNWVTPIMSAPNSGKDDNKTENQNRANQPADDPLSTSSPSDLKAEITLIPNPTTGELRITSNGLTLSVVEVFDVVGKNLFYFSTINNTQATLNIESLHSGLYFVKITTEDGMQQMKKIVKE